MASRVMVCPEDWRPDPLMDRYSDRSAFTARTGINIRTRERIYMTGAVSHLLPSWFPSSYRFEVSPEWI